MNYRHSYHAGNFADVMKHAVLLGAIRHLQKKESGFVVIDTHAGRGAYDLSGSEAKRTGEAADGITRLRGIDAKTALLRDYLEQVWGMDADRHPGSPLLAVKLLRAQDRMIAIEKQPEEFAALRSVLQPFASATSIHADGYAKLSSLLPPAQRRGVILIDPPYEDADEFGNAAIAIRRAVERFATGIFLVWYPLKSRGEANAFHGELAASGAKKILIAELDIGVDENKGLDQLHAAGLAVVNPPFGFAAEVSAMLEELVSVLGRDISAAGSSQWIAGQE